MFKDRSLQVKMVKNSEDAPNAIEEVGAFEVKADIVVKEVKSILTMIGSGVLAYVVADTFRQIAIEKARK